MSDSVSSTWPSFTEREIAAVTNVLVSNRVNYWTGEHGKLFEREFANWNGVEKAVALANGTVALDGALRVLGVGPGDEVIVTPRTFIASVSSIITVGAIPVFADIDRNSQNTTAASIELKISNRTKAIICVHLAGYPCEMDKINELAKANKLFVIEDCAQAHGARYRGQSVGGFGDVGAWSFCQDKIMTTGGEGGMITTNDSELFDAIWSYKDHGKSQRAIAASMSEENQVGFRWIHDSFGTNWRMTEMQAAIGRVQLEYMEDWHSKRVSNQNTLWAACKELSGLRVPSVPDYIDHAAYKCYMFVEPRSLKSGWSRDRILQEINANGVPCFSGSCPEVYLEKAFDNTGLRPEKRLPVVQELGETSLMFLVHPTLTESEIEHTNVAIKQVFGRAVL